MACRDDIYRILGDVLFADLTLPFLSKRLMTLSPAVFFVIRHGIVYCLSDMATFTGSFSWTNSSEKRSSHDSTGRYFRQIGECHCVASGVSSDRRGSVCCAAGFVRRRDVNFSDVSQPDDQSKEWSCPDSMKNWAGKCCKCCGVRPE